MLESFESWLVNLTGVEYLWVVELFLIVLAALTLGFLTNRVIDHLEERAGRTKTAWDDAFIEACRRPTIWLVWIISLNFAVGVAARKMDFGWYEQIGTVNRLAVIFLFALFLVNFIRRAEHNLVNPEFIAEPMDKTTVRAISKLLRASVIITAILIAMQLFGLSVSGVLAFGGIGGIAVGFAAKDLLANFFGGMMIYFDRPFSVGDWVRSPDKEIEGTVEDIGWRLTRIRTFDKRPLYVPNAVFTSIAVENPSRMTNRRIYETIGIRYGDIDKMNLIVEQVKAMLQAHPEIDAAQTLIVNFNKFSASSIDFFVYTFTRTTEWIKFHEIKHDILLKIAEIIAANGAEIAFPTSTVHLPDQLQVVSAKAE